MIRIVALLTSMMIVLAGCSHSTGGVAPSNIPLEPGGYTIVQPDAHGIDCLYSLLGLIPVSGGNETRRAVESAIEGAPGATALINVTADTFGQYWILVGRTCTEVHGSAVSVP